MAKYTIELKELTDSGYDIGLTTYPIFSEAYRTTLNNKIKTHYAYREIGFEMPALFKHHLNMTMTEIMDYYNKLYLAQANLEAYNSIDLTEVTTGTNQAVSAATSTLSNQQSQNDNNKTVHSDTPTGLLSIDSIEGDIYASDATIDKNEKAVVNIAANASQSTGTNTGSGNRRVTGNDGRKNKAELLIDYRKALQNIDMMIIKELNVCFMGVY